VKDIKYSLRNTHRAKKIEIKKHQSNQINRKIINMKEIKGRKGKKFEFRRVHQQGAGQANEVEV